MLNRYHFPTYFSMYCIYCLLSINVLFFPSLLCNIYSFQMYYYYYYLWLCIIFFFSNSECNRPAWRSPLCTLQSRQCNHRNIITRTVFLFILPCSNGLCPRNLEIIYLWMLKRKKNPLFPQLSSECLAGDLTKYHIFLAAIK